jgi:hypothetical protein
MARFDSEMILGTRPDCTRINPQNPDREAAFADALRYAHSAFEPRELKAFALSLLDRPDLAHLPDWHFAVVGKVAWIALEGGTLEQNNHDFIQRKLVEMERYVVDEDDDAPRFQLTAAQRDTQAYVDLYSRLERFITPAQVDQNDIRDSINRCEPKLATLNRCITHFEDTRAGAQADSLRQWVLNLDVILAELRARVQNNRAAKGAARKVTGKVARVIRNVQVKQQDTTYNVVSVNPADVVGSECAVLLNTKTKRLQILRATQGKLDIQGTTVRGFDDAVSYGKTLRNADKDVTAVRKAPTVARVDMIMDKHITGKRHDVSGRLNTDTVILRVF